ncbi:hypothetical protein ABFX02_04G102300 [Erythranthe guttata]
MCYPQVAYWEGGYKCATRRRQLIAPAAEAATEVAARGRQEANTGGGGGGGITKVCVCSPTGHPGSFRCRHHHGEYQWVNRLGPKPS